MVAPILVTTYDQIKNLPPDSYFVFDNGFHDVYTLGKKPYLICKRTGKGQFDFVPVAECELAAEAKQMLKRLENEKPK